jgi:hypothetical protein
MSAFNGAAAGRRRAPGGARHVGSLAAAPLILVLIIAGVASADPPSPVVRLTAAEAARAGSAIDLVRHTVAGAVVLEVRPAPGNPAPASATNLLAVSSDGSAAALADRVGDASGLLILARADGSQLRIGLPGLLAASFAPDGGRLVVVDGRGALWEVDADSGDTLALGDGPFLGAPIVAADGSLLLLAVPSVEAPYRSQLVRFSPSSGVTTPLSSDELVYGAFVLTDGRIAVVGHRPGGTAVRRIDATGGDSELFADLGAGAVNVSVSADGRAIAFEVAGSGIFFIEGPGAKPRRLGGGSAPCLAHDGSSLLVRRGERIVVLAPDGSTLETLEGAARFPGNAGCWS